MKIQLLLLFTALSFAAIAQEKKLDTTLLQTVEVVSTIAGDKVPITKTNFNKQALKKENVGQDLPFVLQSTPGLVANSDAGNGVGYTGLRLRGSDATRINITINGIPYNDAESQGTFLVNIPDVVSSTSSIQVQRGVGSSSNGAGAFGGSIHLKTNEIVKERSTDF
jgi:iron complex outermembrane receptor protein